jgi:hypothetical protein
MEPFWRGCRFWFKRIKGFNQMDSFNKQADQFHPEIIFNQQTGQLSIKGKSIPLNADEFLSDIISWVEQYSREPQDKTNLEIDLKFGSFAFGHTISNIKHQRYGQICESKLECTE